MLCHYVFSFNFSSNNWSWFYNLFLCQALALRNKIGRWCLNISYRQGCEEISPMYMYVCVYTCAFVYLFVNLCSFFKFLNLFPEIQRKRQADMLDRPLHCSLSPNPAASSDHGLAHGSTQSIVVDPGHRPRMWTMGSGIAQQSLYCLWNHGWAMYTCVI